MKPEAVACPTRMSASPWDQAEFARLNDNQSKEGTTSVKQGNVLPLIRSVEPQCYRVKSGDS